MIRLIASERSTSESGVWWNRTSASSASTPTLGPQQAVKAWCVSSGLFSEVGDRLRAIGPSCLIGQCRTLCMRVRLDLTLRLDARQTFNLRGGTGGVAKRHKDNQS